VSPKKKKGQSLCEALENVSNKVCLFKCVHFLLLPNICIENSKIGFTVEFSWKSYCLHPVFGPLVTAYPLFEWGPQVLTFKQSYTLLVWTPCLMHRCVCIWRYILQNYNYILHFQNLSIYHIARFFLGEFILIVSTWNLFFLHILTFLW
jgi:hypothetical protein